MNRRSLIAALICTAVAACGGEANFESDELLESEASELYAASSVRFELPIKLPRALPPIRAPQGLGIDWTQSGLREGKIKTPYDLWLFGKWAQRLMPRHGVQKVGDRYVTEIVFELLASGQIPIESPAGRDLTNDGWDNSTWKAPRGVLFEPNLNPSMNYPGEVAMFLRHENQLKAEPLTTEPPGGYAFGSFNGLPGPYFVLRQWPLDKAQKAFEDCSKMEPDPNDLCLFFGF